MPAIRSTYTPERASFNETINHIHKQLNPKRMDQPFLKFNPFLNVQTSEDHLQITSHASIVYAPKRFSTMLISVMRVREVEKTSSEIISEVFQPNLYDQENKKCIEAHPDMSEDELIGWIEEKTGIVYTLKY